MSNLDRLNAISKSFGNSSSLVPSFLGVYCDIANGVVDREELDGLYFYLKSSLANDTLSKWFQDDPSMTDQIIAVDAVAYEIQSARPNLYQRLFSRDPSEAAAVLDELDGLEAKEEWRRVAREYFVNMGDGDIEIITKGDKLDDSLMGEAQKLVKHY